MNRRAFIQSTLADGASSAVNLPLRCAVYVARKYRNALIGAAGWGGNIVVEAIASNRARVFA